jgi:hypothetical protein
MSDDQSTPKLGIKDVLLFVPLFVLFLGAFGLLMTYPVRWIYYTFASKDLGQSCRSGHECAWAATCVGVGGSSAGTCRRKCTTDAECSTGEKCRQTYGWSKVCW